MFACVLWVTKCLGRGKGGKCASNQHKGHPMPLCSPPSLKPSHGAKHRSKAAAQPLHQTSDCHIFKFSLKKNPPSLFPSSMLTGHERRTHHFCALCLFGKQKQKILTPPQIRAEIPKRWCNQISAALFLRTLMPTVCPPVRGSRLQPEALKHQPVQHVLTDCHMFWKQVFKVKF